MISHGGNTGSVTRILKLSPTVYRCEWRNSRRGPVKPCVHRIESQLRHRGYGYCIDQCFSTFVRPQPGKFFWCRIHLWFRLMGGLQAKSMTSQRYRAVTRWRMCYYGNVMTTTRWWLCYTILHLQQYSHRLNFFLIRRGPGPNKFTRNYLSNFFKFVH